MHEECPANYRHTYSNITHQLTYNLCPLFLQHQALKHEVDEETPPTHTKYVYDIALGRGIRKDGTLPADLQCAGNSFICLTVVNTRPNHPSEPPRILQVVTVATEDVRPKFRLTHTTTGLDLVETHLQLTVHGLQYQGRKQKAVFHMFCDETTAPSELEFLYRWNGTHAFKWRSSQACPEVTPNPNNPEPGPDGSGDTGEDLPPPDPEPETDDSTRSSISQWHIVFAIIILLAVFRKWSIRQKYFHRPRNRLPVGRRYHPQENGLLLEEFGSGRGLQYVQPDPIPHRYTK